MVQIGFMPDWSRHAKAAPFKRNDLLLEALPAGLIVFPGSGITDNLADEAKRLGIPAWKFEEGAPSAPHFYSTRVRLDADTFPSRPFSSSKVTLSFS